MRHSGPTFRGHGAAAIRRSYGETYCCALPAQLRFRDRDACVGLFQAAGFDEVAIAAHSAALRAPSARWLAERLAFAPGMAAQLAALGADTNAVLDQFVSRVEAKQGHGEVTFNGRAFVASGNVI